jgi:hypothetical protein
VLSGTFGAMALFAFIVAEVVFWALALRSTLA